MERIHNFRQLDNNIVDVLKVYWEKKQKGILTRTESKAWDLTIKNLLTVIMCDEEWANWLFARAGIPIHERKGKWLEAGPNARRMFEEGKKRLEERRERRMRRGE